MLKNFLLIIFSIILFSSPGNADRLNEMFYIGKMDSHNKDFTLFFKIFNVKKNFIYNF